MLYFNSFILNGELEKYKKETQLIEGLKKGDIQIFEYIFDMFYKSLCAYANKIVNDTDTAEELVQNVICNLWVKRKTIGLDKSIKSYLFQSVYNASLNYIRRKEVEKKYIKEKYVQYLSEGLLLSSAYEISEYKEFQQKQLQRAIDSLPKKCREVLVLSRFSGLKNKEVAEELGVSINTVQKQLAIAMKKLRDFFAKNT